MGIYLIIIFMIIILGKGFYKNIKNSFYGKTRNVIYGIQTIIKVIYDDEYSNVKIAPIYSFISNYVLFKVKLAKVNEKREKSFKSEIVSVAHGIESNSNIPAETLVNDANTYVQKNGDKALLLHRFLKEPTENAYSELISYLFYITTGKNDEDLILQGNIDITINKVEAEQTFVGLMIEYERYLNKKIS